MLQLCSLLCPVTPPLNIWILIDRRFSSGSRLIELAYTQPIVAIIMRWCKIVYFPLQEITILHTATRTTRHELKCKNCCIKFTSDEHSVNSNTQLILQCTVTSSHLMPLTSSQNVLSHTYKLVEFYNLIWWRKCNILS